ncbi:hypothetical protein BOX15_Mlig014048g2 [Macrostomum lignano]|uniref:Uncharacterized protein n=1 Tax=Macrostomum lignano TaxID=282301 RepID=A0A267EX12_9PLAT|nr:hypothetical protein BOX15_Mlig014048g2 [Macrostomum lignano]
MASGLFMRLQARQAPAKMYGFGAVDRPRQRDIVARLTAPQRPATAASGSHRAGGAAAGGRPASAAPAAAAASSASRVDNDSADNEEDDDDDDACVDDSDGSVCERYQASLRRDSRPRRLLAAESYSRALFARLGRSHTFSSRCKQRGLDPHRLCSRGAGESPDYAPIRDINAAAKAPPQLPPPAEKPHQQQQQQQQQRQGPSLSAVIGFNRLANRAAAKQSPERRQEAAKQRASPFGLVFRTAARRDQDGGGGAEQTVASTAVFGALGRLRYRAKREELQQRQRDQQAKQLRSDWEIVNATEFVRDYERENRRDMQLAELSRPTVSSRFKGVGGSGGVCPFCQEMPELAAEWQQKLAINGKGEKQQRPECRHCGELADGVSATTADTEAAPVEKPAAPAETWGKEEEAALVSRLRAPTRASEGGVPFCRRGQEDAGPWLGSGQLGFEVQRPKSGLERVRSAQKRRELIDALSVRLHSGNGSSGSGGGGASQRQPAQRL